MLIDAGRVLLDDGRYRVITLEGALGAQWWGRGSRWCTVDPVLFQNYRKYGELIYIEERSTGRRWQLYLHRCELRTARNRRAEGAYFAKSHPAVIEALRSRIDANFRARFFFGFGAENEKVDHSLNLRGVKLRSLPRGLHVRDDLDVCDTGIRELPEGLRVGGDLHVSEFTLRSIPADVKIKGIRYIHSKRLLHLNDTIDAQ